MTTYTTEDAKIDPKTNPLFQRLFGKEGFLPLNEANLEEFLAVPGLKMAVFAEDPNAKRVTMDIVVIAPELKKAFAGALSDTRFADLAEARALAARWGLRRFPAVALFRDRIFWGRSKRCSPGRPIAGSWAKSPGARRLPHAPSPSRPSRRPPAATDGTIERKLNQ